MTTMALRGLKKTMDILDAIENDLNHGLLTPRLMSYDDIITLPKKHYEVWLPRKWYYRWCEVQRLSGEHGTFHVTLPLITIEDLEGYQFSAYPVRLGSGYGLLEIASQATLDTATGVVNEPFNCLGQDPAVCNAGPQRVQSCARSLVLRGDPLEACRMHTKVLTEEYYPLTTGEGVMVIDKEEELVERCSGSAPIKQAVTPGTWQVSWDAGCRLEAKDDWPSENAK